MATNFYINGSQINPPYNWKGLQLELNFDRDKNEVTQQATITDWEFVRENNDTILDYIEAGTTGGPGVFEGMPFKVEVTEGSQSEVPFDGYIDLTENPRLSTIRSTVKAKEKNSIDFLNDRAESFTYEYLYKSTSEITSDDFVFVPYVLNSVPDYLNAAIATVSVYVIIQELKNALEIVKQTAAELSNPMVTASAIAKAILQVAYLIVLIATLIKLIVDLIKLIIQPVKYHAGMRVRDLLNAGCEHLGFTFKSDIIDDATWSNLVIIPEKYNNPPDKIDKQILGFITPNKALQDGYFKGTFGDLLRAMKLMFNAKIVVTQDKEIFLIRRDKNVSQAQYQLHPIYNPYFTINTDELISNYRVSFQFDITDKNTVQEYLGTSYQVITNPVAVTNNEMVLMKGFRQIDIPFALAKRKTELSIPEQLFRVMLEGLSLIINGLVSAVNLLISIANGVIKVLNVIIKALKVVGIKVNWKIKTIPKLPYTNLSTLIENRIGMMKIEIDFFAVPKILLLDEGSKPKFNKINANNDTLLSANALYNQFHYIESFVPTSDRPTANQCEIRDYEKVPFTFDDYMKVRNNNRILNADGQEMEFTSLKWNPFDQVAQINGVRLPKLYTTNLEVKILEADGK